MLSLLSYISTHHIYQEKAISCPFFIKRKVILQCCSLFEHFIGQSVLEARFYWDMVSWWYKTIGYQTCRKQDLQLWPKHEKLKFTSLTITPGTAALYIGFWSWSYFRFSSTAHKNMMHFDCGTIFTWQLLQPKQGGPVVRVNLSAILCFPQIWGLNLVAKQ